MLNKLIPCTTLMALMGPFGAYALERSALLPADSTIKLEISNTSEFLHQLNYSSVGKLWADPQFQDFVGHIDEEMLYELIFDGDPTPEDQLYIEEVKMFTGELIAGIPFDGTEPTLIAAISEEDWKRSLEMDEQIGELSEQPVDIQRDTFQDHLLIGYISNGGTPQESTLWQAHTQNTLLLSPSREWVERTLVTLNKEEITEPSGTPTFKLNTPVRPIINEMIFTEADESDQALLKALGALVIKNISLTVSMEKEQMVLDCNLTIDELLKGIFTILDTQPSELPSVTFIPDDIATLEVGRLNLLRLWQEVPTIITDAIPEGKAQYDMALNMIQQQTGIDMEQDLLTYLGTRYFSYSVATEEITTSVVAIELKDVAAFQKGFDTMMNAQAMQALVASALETIDFLDRTIYTTKNPATPEEAIAFCVADGYFLYGSPDGLRQVIRSQHSDAAANTNFEKSELVKGIRRHVPNNAFAYNAVDWKKNMNAMIRQLTHTDYIETLQQQWALSGSPIPPPNMSRMPSASHIASFFNTSYAYAETTPNGIHQRIILHY